MKARDKQFFNESTHEWGYVGWHVSNTRDDPFPYVTAGLKVADCSDYVWLDFNCTTAQEVPKRIKKLDVLIDSLTKLRAAMVEAGTPPKRYY